jgi:uncharacterized protein (DUF1697 family)
VTASLGRPSVDSMTAFVALLRAINVGGTGKLRMTDLVGLCGDTGFKRAATYIQSGNVVFGSPLPEAKVKAKLEKALAAHMGKPFGALIRTGKELETVLVRNPFKKAAPNRVIVLFLDEAPPPSALHQLVIPGAEEVALVGREIFVHYPEGQGSSKLKISFAKTGTGRNLNTVAKLVAMAHALEE